MRRIALMISVPLLAVAALAGCGSSSSQSSASNVAVSGGFGSQPSVKIPSSKAGSSLTVKTLVHDPPYPHDVQRRVPATGKARRMLGFEAATTLSQMLDEVIPWVAGAIAAGTI